ncbi:PH domain-containing protein [Candidatus Cyanaurora vandensis]|uniref:PH domain-containing protein n=1 Tax=Candidatus Cyanaurora vandensis TaxID=2714958 RepID=UPI002580B004|nr:PH domain-containing protein [Candidatus Cyanaurora vandensis]
MAIQEEIIYEGRPHVGDLIASTLLLFTIIWVVFWIPAVVNYVFSRYRFTNRRITVEGGWLGRNRTDVIYREVESVRAIPATVFGSIFGYGVLLIVLRDGAKLELKAVPKFREIAEYIEDRIDQYSDRKTTTKT